MKLSVCMATYNGGKFLKAQLQSIVRNLSKRDEVIICDDSSTDDTISVIKGFKDERILLYENETRLGYVRNFEKCIGLASGDVIFLSDQDDIWPPNRVQVMLDCMRGCGKSVVVGNIETFTDSVEDRKAFGRYFRKKHNRSGFVNLFGIFFGNMPYFGCCMALKKEALGYVLPFPSREVSHDIWIAIAANIRNDISHIEHVVIYRRLHDSNVTTSNRSLAKKLKSRQNWFMIIKAEIIRKRASF